MDGYRFLRQVWPYIGPVVGLLALGGFFGLPISDVLAALEKFAAGLTALKIGYLIAGVLSIFFAYVEFRHRNVPLTAVQTDVDVIIHTATGDRATVSRTQKIRANHENITGYRRNIGTSGRIPRESIQGTADHCPSSKQRLHIEGDPSKWEVIHRFEPIPRKLWLLGLNTIQRTDSHEILDGFCFQDESYEMLIPEPYRHNRITISIYFHPDRQCNGTDCSAIKISDAGIVEMNLAHVHSKASGGGGGVQLKIRNPRAGERYRINWHHR